MKDLEQEFKNVRQKIEIAGLSQALGQILREQRRKLPGVRGYRRDAKKRQEEIAQAGLALFRVEEQARGLLDADTVIHQILAEQLPADTPEEDYNHVADQLRALVRDREALLEKYRDALNDYVSTLGALDFAQRRLVVVATAYADFLDEHLLWIPSATPVGWQTLKDLGASLVWVTAVDNWRTLAAGVKREVTQSPLLTVAVLLVFAALMLGRRRLRADLTAIAERVAKPATDRFTHTLQALLVTGLLAAPWPVLFAFFGFRLENEVDAAEFTRAVGNGLLAIAVPFFMLRSFRVMCAKSGLVRAHFQWRERPVKLLRRYLAGLMTVMIPAAFVTGLAGWDSPEAYRDSLGRLAFVVWALSLAVFAWLALRTPGGLLDENLIANPRGWLARSRPLWYTLALGAPLAVCGLALSGYYYSALQLAGEMIPTLRLIAAAVIGHELVIRWLTLANRRLAQIRARERREAARAKEAVKEAVSASGDAAPATLEFAEVDIPAINTQTRQLLRTVITLSVVVGLWWIWSAVVPALGFLDHVTLWTYTTVMDGQETRAPITLLNLGMAVVLVMVFVAAARNLPGVLEILVLRRMELEPGSRYAVITVIKYAIAAIGGIVVFNAIGVQWSQLQWLIAALSVGLGFGLQEIVANFVSGLIILFERPIRVGDTVTVGGVSGTVTRIRIRATTITDWDRKELVVPNKTFITEQVVNWSLSDPITRVIVPVGIAYGSDTRRAHQVILDAVRAQPLVLDDPKPTVFFLGFGDSSLNFEVRAFVRELNKRLPLMHELHMAIDQALRDNGIEIPFPQRDLHIRSSAVPLGGSGGKPDAADAGEAPA